MSHSRSPPAAKRKSVKKKVTTFRRTSTFTSSEDEEVKDKPDEGNQRNTESKVEAAERPTTWKCDVRVERLHKNIVDHKLGQYRRWQERQEELKSKPAGNIKPAVASKSKTAKSKAVVAAAKDAYISAVLDDLETRFEDFNEITKAFDCIYDVLTMVEETLIEKA